MQHNAVPYERLKTADPSSLRILVTNDDGVYAPGLGVLTEIAKQLSEDVWIVAPETEQSGAGHSLTINQPLRLFHVDEEARRYAVSGTPTDCVLMACKVLLKDRQPDLILSGVNRGSNLGEDVTYSGTIAACMEGTLLDIPSIAFSLGFADIEDMPWDTARHHAPGLIRQLLQSDWQPNTLLNVNFPPCHAGAVKGVRACPHGKRAIGDKLIQQHDPKGRPYWWIGGDPWDRTDWEESDIAAVRDGYIAVTPLSMDLTHYEMLSSLQRHVEG